MTKVLVTGAGALLGQGVLRALKLCSIPTEIVAVDPSPYAVGLYWADRSHLVPLASDPAYLDAIREILAKERPDVVMLGTDVELRAMADHRGALEKEFDTQILVSDPYVIEVADDKFLTASFLEERGFPYPMTVLPGDQQRLIEAVGFPLIVKPRVGARSIGVKLVRDRAELRQALGGVPDVVIQEHVGSPREEFTTGVLYFEGQEPVSITMRRDLRDGNTYRAFVGEYPEFNAMMCKVAVALACHGPINFQFRIADGVPKIFEINARYSGTTPLRARAGFNEVEMALAHLVHGKPLVQPQVKHVNFFRYWDDLMIEPSRIISGEGVRFDLESDA